MRISLRRVEGFYRVIHQTVNGPLALEQSAGPLASKIIKAYTALVEIGDKAVINQARGLNFRSVHSLNGTVRFLTIQLTKYGNIQRNNLVFHSQNLPHSKMPDIGF